MLLLIDGYNLLNATGIVGRGIGAATLQRSRRALLNFLTMSLEPDMVSQTTIVFDAKQAPPGLPHRLDHGGITVIFARGYDDADELIEELIASNSTPRRLTVVSSDHRIQRAARRRRATAIESGPWYGELVEQLRARRDPVTSDDTKPATPLSETEVENWLAEFGDIALDVPEADLNDGGNPFPPGYGEDLLEE